jgi:Predicted membrane protein (DUF2127)
MYCNRCGGVLTAGSQFCEKCGERVLPGAATLQQTVAQQPVPVAVASVPVAQTGRVQRNIGILAALWMINGLLRLLEVLSLGVIGRVVFPPIFGGHLWGWRGFPFNWGGWPAFGLAWIGVLLGVFGVIHLILAWGLYERKTWARPLGLVIGILALIRFPLGTALGIYTLWVLLPEMSRREYEQIAVP